MKIKRTAFFREAKFFISTIISFFIGIPGSGRGANLLLDRIAKLFSNSTDIPPKWISMVLGQSRFLNYNSLSLIEFYPNEKPISGQLPYVEIASILSKSKNIFVEIELRIDEEEFFVSDWQNPEMNELVHAGYRELVKEGHNSSNKNIVKIKGWKLQNHKLIISISKTKYEQQAKSNLILDYTHDKNSNNATTLRKNLLAEYPGIFPPISDPRMANTLGVATLILYSSDGVEYPFLVQRSRDVAVYNQAPAWHCTSSFAARWDIVETGISSAYEQIIVKHQYLELEKEAGITPNIVFDLKPVGFCREMLRGGKPQLFCIGRTNASFEDLCERFEAARLKVKNAGERVEALKMPVFRRPPARNEIDEIVKEMKSQSLTLEATMMLYYWSQQHILKKK